MTSPPVSFTLRAAPMRAPRPVESRNDRADRSKVNLVPEGRSQVSSRKRLAEKASRAPAGRQITQPLMEIRCTLSVGSVTCLPRPAEAEVAGARTVWAVMV